MSSLYLAARSHTSAVIAFEQFDFVFCSPFSPAHYRMLSAVVAVFAFLHVQSWVGRDLEQIHPFVGKGA